MIATNRFKKDFGYYLLGIIVPGLLNVAMVPIVKHFLGTEIFGAYSLKFNFLLLLMAVILGGLCQGVIRFKASVLDSNAFYALIFSIAWRLLLPIAVSCVCVLIFYFHQSFLSVLLYALCIVGCGIQNVAMAISQAGFHSRYLILTESIRAAVFFLLVVLIIFANPQNREPYLFLALFVSYVISSILLLKKNKVQWRNIFSIFPQPMLNNTIGTKAILMYGVPLVLWFSTYYSILYLDKLLIAKYFGLTVQGNYQAMSDIVFRGITFLLAPVSTAIFPILNQSEKQKLVSNEFSLLKKIFVTEICLLFLFVLTYWYCGFWFLAQLLSVPNLPEYKIAGVLIICFSVIWQMAMIAHKPLEMAKKTNLMFGFIIFAFCVYLISFLIIQHFFAGHLFAFIIPCLLAGIVYNVECVWFSLNVNKPDNNKKQKGNRLK